MTDVQRPFIFGVKIDNITYEEILSYIDIFLTSETYHHIVTLNPEILLKSRENNIYKNILNSSSLNIVDGIGIKFALLCQIKHLKMRFAGVDLMHEVLKAVDLKSGSVFIAVNVHGLSNWKIVENAFVDLYPHISFKGRDVDPKNCEGILNEISADVVLCNFGAPEQEFFLHKLRPNHAKIGIGVGGSFDYISGIMPRAPRYLRKIGMEWFYRLYKQPQRWKRIYNAVIIFPVLVLFNKKNDT